MTDDILEYILHLFTPFCNQKRHFSNLIFLYRARWDILLHMSSRTMKNDLQKYSCFFMWCWRKITENVSHVISTRISPTLTTFCNIKLYFHHFSSFRHKTKKITLFTVDPSKRIFIKNGGQNFHIIKVWTFQKSCWL